MKPAVVLSAHVIGLGVVRGLGEAGVPVIVGSYAEHDMGVVSRYVRELVRLPHPEKEETAFIGRLIATGERIRGAVLFPADDATLSVVARHREALSKVFAVACCDWSVVQRVINKEQTYALARCLGTPTPRTSVAASLDAAKTLAAQVGFPCLVKPCESHRFFEQFGRKMTRVGDGQELVAAYEEAARAGMKVMVQELIQGGDECGVNYNCLMIEGEPIVEFTAEKVRLSPPTFGVPRVVISKRIPEIIEPGRAILRGLGFQGFACTEFKRDVRTGTYQFMEVNGRHNRSGMLAVSCGINFPLLEYEFLAYGKSPKPASFREGVYWIDDVKDFVESFRHRAVERYSWRQLARPYFQPHVYAVWDWRDPKPLLKRCRDLMLAAGNGRREKASSSAA